MNSKLIVITPVHHLSRCPEILRSCCKEVVFLPDCNLSDLLEHLDANYIFTNPNKRNFDLSASILSQFKELKAIATASTGTNHIDLNFCRANDVNVISLTEARSVINKITGTAEHALCLALCSLRKIKQSFFDVSSSNWDYLPSLGRQFNTLKIGVVGYGRLGTLFAHYCRGLGANIFVYDPYKTVYHPDMCQVYDITELFRECDLISIHVHVTPETKGFINSSLLNLSRKPLHIVNTSRGEIVNEADIIDALHTNPDFYYSSDVISDESSGLNNSDLWRNHKNNNNLTLTPHTGGMTLEGQEAAFSHAAELLYANINKL